MREYRGPDFAAQSPIVVVDAGAGIGVAQKVIVASEIPSGGSLWLDYLTIRITSQAAYDQLYFSLRLNGARLTPFDYMPGEQFFDEYRMAVGRKRGPGLLEIAATNISGTTEPGNMQPGVPISVVASFRGSLLIPRAVA